MAGVNKVILVGNLGIDPEIRTLESGVKVARLRIATSESYTNKEGIKVENTEWHTVTMWRALADIAEKYLAKGKQVYVEGKLRTRSWKDAEGNDRYSTEVVADNMQMLGRAGDDQNQGGSQQQAPKQQSSPQQSSSQQSSPVSQSASEEDDLPF
ncbi:MAG: single-stranded DNA-binding protein [Cryomorphaceae bacterium]